MAHYKRKKQSHKRHYRLIFFWDIYYKDCMKSGRLGRVGRLKHADKRRVNG